MIHIVQKGDTLYKIAQHYYGDGSRYPEIAAANNIDDVNLIHEWDMLEIPGVKEEKMTMPTVSAQSASPAPSTPTTDKSALTKQIVTVVLVVGGIVLAYYLWQNSQSMNVATNPEEDEDEDEDDSEDDEAE